MHSAISFLPDGNSLIAYVVGQDGLETWLVPYDDSKAQSRRLFVYKDRIFNYLLLATSPDGRHIAQVSGIENAPPVVVSIQDNDVRYLSIPEGAAADNPVFSPDGHMFASSLGSEWDRMNLYHNMDSIRIWDLDTR